jgi:hypothetical protein
VGVRHQIGTLSAISLEPCPPSPRNAVRHRSGTASGIARNTHFGLFSRLGEQRFFATLGEAVSHYLESQSVAWVDWEDEAGGETHHGAQVARMAGPPGPPTQTR